MKVTADKYELKNVNELKEYVQIGGNCQFCIPFIEMMLKTGKTEFEVIMNDNC
jgi:hypothetical protein